MPKKTKKKVVKIKKIVSIKKEEKINNLRIPRNNDQRPEIKKIKKQETEKK